MIAEWICEPRPERLADRIMTASDLLRGSLGPIECVVKDTSDVVKSYEWSGGETVQRHGEFDWASGESDGEKWVWMLVGCVL